MSTDSSSPSARGSDLLRTTYGRRAVTLAIAGAVGGFLFGFDSSVINGAVDSIQHDFGLNDAITGFVVAIALLGSALGAVIAGNLADRWGRLRVMFLGGAMFLISSIGAGLAEAVWVLALFRVIGGLGIGIASVIAPAYIAEVAPKQARGTLASFQQLAITIGIFAALLSDALLSSAAGGAASTLWWGLEAWRWMFLVGIIPSVVYALLAFILPESPRFLIAQGRMDEARTVYSRLVPPEHLNADIADIERAIAEDKAHAGASLRGRLFGLQPVVWAGIILSIFQQFVGINVIFYYSTTLWSSVGFGESSAMGISVFTSVVNILVTLVAVFFADKVGRKPLLLGGSAVMTVALGTMAIAFAFSVTDSSGAVSLPGAWGPVALVAANLFVVGFGATWGPLVWVLLGEIFPARIRGKALGVAASAQWIANFIITMTFPVMSGWSLPLTYGMYALFAALSFFFVKFRIPETKGVDIDETSKLFT